MNKLLFLCFAFVMSCTTSITTNQSQDMQKKIQIIASESNGGSEKEEFKIINNQKQLETEIIRRFTTAGIEPIMAIPDFPNQQKVVIYDLGRFNSGDHRINEIKNISVQDNILYVEVPRYESGGMEIQVLSNPWFIFSVPSSYKFSSVQLKTTQ